MSRPRRLVASLWAAALVLAGSAAHAQDARPSRPYRGLFGGGSADAAQTLTAIASAGSGYDTNFLADAETGVAASPFALTRSAGTVYGMLSGSLAYAADTDRVDIGASVSSTVRRYTRFEDRARASLGSSAGAVFALTSSTTITASESISYQPALFLVPFVPVGEAPLGQAAIPDQDFLTVSAPYVTIDLGGSIRQQLSRRSAVSVSYARQAADFSSGELEYRRQTAGAGYSYALARGLGVRIGVGFSEADYGAFAYRGFTLDSGIDYSRALSVSRRTRLSFSSGATGVRDEVDVVRYSVIGSANLTHEIGRTWTAGLAYARNVGFIESLRTPYFYDGGSVSLAGLVSRRLTFRASGGVMYGDLIPAPGTPAGRGDEFDVWHGTMSLGVALSRHLAVTLSYAYYQYSFGSAPQLPPGVPGHMSRHSIRASFDTWASIFQRGSRSDAAR